jgi:hypothetical protein
MDAQQYTLGVGVYPGDPKENCAPVSHLDQTYSNLALQRPVYHSSSYDYNLTAQLITDGIKDTKLPRWVVVSTSEEGELKKNEREWLLDHNWLTAASVAYSMESVDGQCRRRELWRGRSAGVGG